MAWIDISFDFSSPTNCNSNWSKKSAPVSLKGRNCYTQVEVQTQICFWSDFPDRNYLWSEFPDGIHPDQTFQTQVTSDHRRSLTRLFRSKVFWSDHLQTMVQTQIQTIAQNLIRLWSDSNALEDVMIRPKCARSSHDQTQLRLQLFMIRLKCAPNRFWSDSGALEIVWSETDFTYEKIS